MILIILKEMSFEVTPPNTQAYIIYSQPIDNATTNRFMTLVNSKIREGKQRITVLISSPGGQVNAGISIHNFLRGLPIEIITHNFGQSDSIAMIIFCAGRRRYTTPNSRFLIHGIGFDAQAGQRFDERLLGERLEGIKSERITLATIISQNTTRSLENIEADMLRGVVWSPEQAMEYGLVHEIKQQLYELGSDVSQV
jgi:ATP-dependent Clp protease protease subunit